MDKTHVLQRFLTKIFPKQSSSCSDKWKDLSLKEKHELSLKHLRKGEALLLKKDLKGLKYFEAVCELTPHCADHWYCIGKAFLQYALLENEEKAFRLASKHFTQVIRLDPNYFYAYLDLGSTLTQLGKFHNEPRFLSDAKKKFELATDLSEQVSSDSKGKLYWEIALLWMALSKSSGEAVDLRMAVQSFCTSLRYQSEAPTSFWKDFGNAYLKMGHLINDSKMFFQAIEYFRKVIKGNPNSYEGWFYLAKAYSQLYIHTIDEHYYNHANECFTQSVKRNGQLADLWLHWAELLGHVGSMSKDPQRFRYCIEKCVRVQNIDSTHPLATREWIKALSQLGLLTHRLDLMVEAENKAMKAIDQFPDEPELWYAYGFCLTTFGKYYDDPDFFEAAIEKAQHGLSLDKSIPKLWHLLANAHYELANSLEDVDLYKQACELYARSHNLNPVCPLLSFDYAQSLLKYGDYSADLESIKKSKSILETLIHTHKNALLQHPNWLFSYAISLFLLGELTDDETYYTRAIEIFLHVVLVDPQYLEVYFHTAMSFSRLGSLTLEKETFHRALSYYGLALKQDAENDQIWLEWGLTLIHLADISEDEQVANQYFLQAEQKIMRSGQLGNEHAYYQMACLCSLTNRLDKAMDFIKKAQQFDGLPPIEEVMEDEWLENLRSYEEFTRFISCLETNQNTAEEL